MVCGLLGPVRMPSLEIPIPIVDPLTSGPAIPAFALDAVEDAAPIVVAPPRVTRPRATIRAGASPRSTAGSTIAFLLTIALFIAGAGVAALRYASPDAWDPPAPRPARAAATPAPSTDAPAPAPLPVVAAIVAVADPAAPARAGAPRARLRHSPHEKRAERRPAD